MGVYIDLLLAGGSAGVMTACIAGVLMGGRLPGNKKIPVELLLLGAIGSMTLFLDKGQPGLLTQLLEQLGMM